MRTPDLFIVGAPKCGTTALYHYLKQHPEIYMSPVKEPQFFGSDLQMRYRKRPTLKQYLSLFSDVKDEKAVGEASTWYLYSERAATEIKEFCPHASIIIMLRNPLDMMYSLHSESIYQGYEGIDDFEAALEAEIERKVGLRIPKNTKLDWALFYRETARSTDHVRRYFDIFGRERVHVVVYDDFKNDVAASYGDTLHFLGVNESFVPQFEVKNSNKYVPIRTLHRMMQSHSSVPRRVVRSLVPYRFRSSIEEFVLQFNTSHVPRTPMNPDLRLRLQAEFAPEVERLSELLGRDLTHWCSPEPSSF